MTMNKLTLDLEGDTHVVITRRFAASPEEVYRAHTEASIPCLTVGPCRYA